MALCEVLPSSSLPEAQAGCVLCICSFSPRAKEGPGGQQEEFYQVNCIAAAEGLHEGVSAMGTGSSTGLPVLRVPGLPLTITQVYVTRASHFLCLKVSLKSPRLEKTG